MNIALNNAIEARKWTHEKLAKRAGMKRVSVTKIINGRMPSMKSAYKIAEALGERVDDIFLPSYVLELNTYNVDD